MRRATGEVLVRFALFCGAFGLVRWATVTFASWREEFSSSFEVRLDVWLGWIALLIAAGLVVGVACLPGRPARYRIHVPLAITLPALLPLIHYALVMEALRREWSDLPWILDHFMFYTDTGPQYAFALIAGFGIAAGFRERPKAGPPEGTPGPEPQ